MPGEGRLAGIPPRTAGMLVVHTLGVERWQEARLSACEAAGSRPCSPFPLFTFAGLARGAIPVTTVRNAGPEFRRRCRCRIHAGDDRRADDHPPALILPRPRRHRPPPGSRWGSSTRSPSRSSASPIRTPGGRCRSRRSSAKVGTRPGCHRPTVRAARPGRAGSMPRTATFTGCGSSRSLRGSTTAPKGNAYLGAYTLFTPLSRRLELITNVPFVLRNNAVTRLAHHRPEPAGRRRRRRANGIRRYLVHAPRLAARDERLLAHGRARGGDPDRQPAPGGERPP